MDPHWPTRTTDAQATSSFYNSLSVAYMSEIATELGRSAEAAKYAQQFDQSTSAFYGACASCALWASCCGAELENATQTSLVMALALNPRMLKTKGGSFFNQ